MQIAETRLLKSNYSLTFGTERTTRIAAAGFLLFLCLFDVFYTQSGFAPLFEFVSRDYDPINILVSAVYSLAALYLAFLFILGTVASRWRYKIIYLSVFAFAIFIEYGYSKALGRFTNIFDITGALSATSEQRMYSLSAFIDLAAFIPFILLVGICFLVKNNGRAYGAGLLGTVIGLTCLFYIQLAYTNPILFDRQFTTTSLGSFFHTTTEYLISNPIIEVKPKIRELVEIPVHAQTYEPNNNIIFVFDESVRGDHLSLNGYERPTTPFLEKLANEGLLLNWGIAVSGSTISHPSYDAMISGASPDTIVSMGLD
nr:sulfatase-like hydrolase/transferase [Blastocatellia bacterium]